MKKTVQLAGLFTGLLNGFFGAGGGMAAVPLLRRCGLDEKEAHATSIGLVLPLSLISGWLYVQAGTVSPRDVLPYLPGALLGSAAGGLLMPYLSSNLIKKAFSLLLLFSAFRMLLR